jgi:hypothetical protein
MSIEIEENPSTKEGRRRRAPGDLSNFTGGTFDATGRDMVKSKVCLLNISIVYTYIHRIELVGLTMRFKKMFSYSTIVVHRREQYFHIYSQSIDVEHTNIAIRIDLFN